MAADRLEHRLVAILAADVVGYSRLMEHDEAWTLSTLKARRRDIFVPEVTRHRGRVVKWIGDGALVLFQSAVDAVEAAIAIAHGFTEANRSTTADRKIQLRIGINLGDVVIDGGDIFGDGVNLAARLQQISDVGGICISQNVYDQVRRKVTVEFEQLGPQFVKNMSEPVVVFRIRALGNVRPDAGMTGQAVPAKPSIAVLPFSTFGTSGDHEQESFADGLAEDLITDLSRNSSLFVIARNSSFSYKGKNIDVRRIAGDLGVRYVIEGSARRAAGRVRINVQLIDALNGNHVWAERYDRGIDDMFAVQDEVTAKVIEAMTGHLQTTPPRNRPKSMEAYDLTVRARQLTEESPQASAEARLLLDRAIELDPEFAEAHRCLALTHWIHWAHWGAPILEHRHKAIEIGEKAVRLDPKDAGCRWILGMIYAYEGRVEESDREFAKAIELDPNCADAWAEMSDVSVLSGQLDEGLAQIQKAFRLNPMPPPWYYLLLGQAEYARKNYDKALAPLRHESTYRTHSRRILAAALAQLGRLDEARREAMLFLVTNPHFTISHWADYKGFGDEAVRAHFVEGYRKAGLPE
ncbi:MAG TPA: adenylate/guanylate cyclase domain-containing protein [Dongiaceae bacterium]|nr:adenylate/guanylate cyclase domain-containing protein [Dongiaceae bacterium]